MFISDTARDKVRARMASFQVDAVTIRRGNPTTGALDTNTGLVGGPSSPSVVYSGRAHCRLVSPSGTVSVGEGQIAQSQLSVTIPYDAALPRVDDELTIDEALGDDQLNGTVWRVLGVSGGGSWGAIRELSCSAWAKSAYWDGGS